MNNISKELPLNEHISSQDLWTIFTRCPIEKGHIDVYLEYLKALERERKMAISKQDVGME